MIKLISLSVEWVNLGDNLFCLCSEAFLVVKKFFAAMKYSTMMPVLFIFCFPGGLLCQTIQTDVYGKISDADSNGIAYANVLLLNERDSILVEGAVTDELGGFVFTGIAKGTYRIESSRVGYLRSYSQPIIVSDEGKLILSPIVLLLNELEEVTVKGDKPLYEMAVGKMIINVQSSVTSTGLSVIDILERSPGITVNRQNNSFSVGGKDGVIVLMNGKRNRMPVEGLYQMLAGMSASNIEKIEVMTVPPANYDADGDAGLINIVLQRGGEGIGTHARLTTGLSYGTDPHGNFTLGLNHQGQKISWYGDYSINVIVRDEIWESYRASSNDRESLATFNNTDRNVDRTVHNYQLGFDYAISPTLMWSGLVSGYSNLFRLNAPAIASYDYSISPDTLVELTMSERNLWKHQMGNLNLRYALPKQVINLNLDYLTYRSTAPSNYHDNYYSELGSFIREEESRIAKNTPINLWVAKVDHSVNWGRSSVLESGIKGTFSKLTNEVVYEFKQGSSWVRDPSLSNYSVLEEDILATYSSIKIEPDSNTIINAGIRYEYSLTDLTSAEHGQLVDRKYGEFFPSFFIWRRLKSSDHAVQVSYGRRITRPSFNQMAPYVIFIDPYTFFAGNVTIVPTFTHSVKVDYSIKSFMFSLQYSSDKDLILRHQPHMTPDSDILTFIADNIDSRKTLSASLTFPLKLRDWWEFQSSLTTNVQSVNSELNEEFYKVKLYGIQYNMSHTFQLPQNYKLEFVGFYASPTTNGYFNWKAMGAVNIGMQKEFDSGGILRVNCKDIFQTNQLRWKSYDGTDIYISGRMRTDPRTLSVTYIRELGNSKIKDARKRTVGSEEEQRRVSN